MAEQAEVKRRPDVGDLIVVLLAATLRGVSCSLDRDGFSRAADLVMELALKCDSYVDRLRSASASYDLDDEGRNR